MKINFKDFKDFLSIEPKLNYLLSKVNQIQENLESNQGICIDNSKSIIESVTKTIFKDRKLKYDNNIKKSIIKLIKELDIFEKVEKSTLKIFLSSFYGSLQGFNELRNSFGDSSHGKSCYDSKARKELVILTIEHSFSLFKFIWSIHKNYKKIKILCYDDNKEFNDFFDEEKGQIYIEGVDNAFIPSEVLYLDKEAYKIELAKYYDDKKQKT